MSDIAIWAGLECTVNRVEGRFNNQCEKNKHVTRISDLEKFAALGIKHIRYPAIWELVSPEKENEYDWHWLDDRFAELKRLKLEPIVGLIHHGSGPKFTSLIDPEFPQKFARYAKAFAERYPWIQDYTPINEILTTAFFSCLYGHWFPHRKSDKDAVLAVMTQVKASILAMKEIRKINPQARLIQTEDIGRTQGTEKLKYQVDFQNERRFLSYDALCGHLDKYHFLYDWLISSGMTDADMNWLKNNACTPDILGVNHYLLSDRYLDHRLKRHPTWSHGGNGIDAYADVGAIDTTDVIPPSPGSILENVWDRYHIPIAVTEAHLNGPREAQMQWLHQIWNEANNLKINKGVDILAVTAWSLLGTYDWNNLCTTDEGFYESGVFDLQTGDGQPRETAVAKMVRDLAKGENYFHPVLDQAGWWLRKNNELARPLLITGGKGTLASAFARICEQRGLKYILADRSHMDLAEKEDVARFLPQVNPWAIINTAGYVKVDQAEVNSYRCFRENVNAPLNLADWCSHKKIPFVTFSTDLVFGGDQSGAYQENHQVNPLNVYGFSKAQCEQKVLSIYPSALVVRTSSFFGPWDEYNFVTQALRNFARKKQVNVPQEILVTPTFIPDLVNTTLDLLLDGEQGLVHLTNDGTVTWAQFAKLANKNSKAKIQEIDRLLIETPFEHFNFVAKRPKNSALVSQRFRILPPLENAISRYFSQLETPVI